MVGVAAEEAADAAKTSFATAVGSKVTSPGTATKPRTPATTATRVATSPGTAKSLRRSVSSAATTVAKLAMWPATAIMPMSRNATPVGGLDIFRSSAIRSSATGAERLATWRCSAARPARSTATTVGRRGTWPRSAPSRPQPSPVPLLPLLYLMVVIFSESSLLAKRWQMEASRRPPSPCHVRGGRG